MRLKIFILSTLLITLISGVLFYKNLNQISVGKNLLRLDIDELRSINLQINNTAYYLRQNLNTDMTEFENQMVRVGELVALVNDINKSSPELKSSVEKIRTHFQKKIEVMKKYETAVKELRASANSLMPTYNEMEKLNIKFVLDKRDFYRECVLDAFMFISFSHKDNESRITEDQKILGQIISYAQSPNPVLQKFASQMDVIHHRILEIDAYLLGMREDTISPEVKIIAKYYQDSMIEQNEQNENLLTFMFVSMGFYLVFMIYILRKD
jgi:DNA repair ATPase RecN